MPIYGQGIIPATPAVKITLLITNCMKRKIPPFISMPNARPKAAIAATNPKIYDGYLTSAMEARQPYTL